MTRLERQLRAQWLGGAAQVYFGRCDTCGRTHNGDDRPLLVARQKRRRGRECFDCYADRKDGYA